MKKWFSVSDLEVTEVAVKGLRRFEEGTLLWMYSVSTTFQQNLSELGLFIPMAPAVVYECQEDRDHFDPLWSLYCVIEPNPLFHCFWRVVFPLGKETS